MSRGMTVSKRLRIIGLLVLALLAGPAFALGLGQIEVKSRHGQPLLAEIPIISSDPAELEQLQARLASPETFTRIGLDPPSGLVSDLQFAVALDPQGRPVIRITTVAPVQEPLLTFLVEVDWGQGRLVREYSALVDAPQTVSAPAQPPIQAPELAPSDAIVRPAETVAGTPPETAGAPVATDSGSPTPQSEASPETSPEAVAAETPADASVAPAPEPAPAPVAPAAAPIALGAGAELAPVRAGQTLSEIAATISRQTGYTLNQTMVALLRANPEAFIRGNINLVREGAVLRLPGDADWSSQSAREATAIVREQVAQWRELRQPVPQPVEAVSATTAAAGETSGAASRVADARLEIVPPSSGAGQQAGTRSGIAAGGEGDMLQQQELLQARETIAARDAEVEELKARVADLEKLQQQQQQLISMKDSELAAAQQRLATSNQQPAPTLASTTQPAAAGTASPAAALPWMWIGLGLVAVALLLTWWMSRRASRTKSRPSFLSASAASTAAAPSPAASAPVARENASPASPVSNAASVMAASGWPNAAPAPAPVSAPPVAAPPWHAAGNGAAQAATIAPLNPAPAGQERLELARAYLELGDTDTARTLLQEVADAGDAASRGEATRLLRELV